MASQRKMAVLPKWAGMFFMSVIMGGSGGGAQTDGRENKAISIRLRKGEVQAGRPRSPVEYPREKTKLGFMNSGVIMHPRIYMYINNTSSCCNRGGPVRVEVLAPGRFAAQGEGVLTVDCNLNLALVGRGHSVVGDALVVLRLLPLNLRDVQELPLAH